MEEGVGSGGRRRRWMTAKEERELLVRYKQHNDREARDKLVESQTIWAKNRILRWTRHLHRDEREELIESAPIAVLTAIEAIDLSRNVRLSTVVPWHVKNLIERRFRVGAIATTVAKERTHPKHAKRAKYSVSIGSKAEPDEESSDDYWHPAVDDNQLDRIQDEEAKRIMAARVNRALNQLDARERDIVRRNVMGTETLENIGVEWDITRERVRQIRDKALHSLKEILDKPTTGEDVAMSDNDGTQDHDLLEKLDSLTLTDFHLRISKLERDLKAETQKYAIRIEKLTRLRDALFPLKPTDATPRALANRRTGYQTAPGLGTKTHRIWKWLLENGPAKHSEIVAALGKDAPPLISGNISRYFKRTDEGYVAIPAGNQSEAAE